jgi:hypothetical protein
MVPMFQNVLSTESQLPAVKLEPSEIQPLNKSDNITEAPQALKPSIKSENKLEPSYDIKQELKPNDPTESNNKHSNENFVLPARHQPQIHKQFQVVSQRHN